MSIRKRVTSCFGILAMLAVFTNVKAQFYIGAEVGGNQNYLVTDVSSLNATEIVPKNGLAISAVIQYKVNDWFSLESTPGFIQKNYQMQRTGYYAGIYQKTRNNYLQLPVSAKFYFGTKKWKGFVDLGVYGAYWASSHIKGTMATALNQNPYSTYYDPNANRAGYTVFDFEIPVNFDDKYQFNSIKDRRLEMGLTAGAGISYEPKGRYKFFADFKYYDALTDQQKNYQDEIVSKYNETGAFSIGFLYNLNIKIKKHINKKKKSILEIKK